MSALEVQPTESNPPPAVVKPQVTLGRFIDDNSKLVTSMAAFVALTAFSSQLNACGIKDIFPELTF